MSEQGFITTSAMNDTQHRQTGFTIIELIIAIVIFAILVPSTASFLALLNDMNDRARDTAIINALAENKVESLRSAKFTSLADGTTNFTNELPQTITAPRSATYQISTPQSGLKMAFITITYNDHGRQKTLSYKTYIGELGVGQY